MRHNDEDRRLAINDWLKIRGSVEMLTSCRPQDALSEFLEIISVHSCH
jgi:hypothetical protein